MMTRHAHLLALAALLSIALAPAAAWADGPSIGIGLRGGFVATPDPQRDPVSTTNMQPVTGFTFDIEPVRGMLLGRDRLRVGLEWDFNSEADQPLFQSIFVDSFANHLLLTADYGFDVTTWFTPYVKVTVGLGFYDLSVAGSGPDLVASDYGLFSGTAGAGLEFIVPYSFWGGTWTASGDNTDASSGELVPGDNTVGARVELGHTLRQAPDFTLTQSGNTPEDAVDIPVEGTRIGTLPVNGLYLTFDLFVRF